MVSRSLTAAVETGAELVGVALVAAWLGVIVLTFVKDQIQLGVVLLGFTLVVAALAVLNER